MTGPECTCSDTNYLCTGNECVLVDACVTDTDCYAPYGQCVSGQCVQCETDIDCSNAEARCVANVCEVPECETNLDCPAFYACEERECVHVGCANNRECMTYEDSYLAVCNSAATPVPECEVRCAHDAECFQSSNPLRLCVNDRCVDPGCETNEECKLRGSGVGWMPGIRAVCRDKL